jgi:hypothetical protein
VRWVGGVLDALAYVTRALGAGESADDVQRHVDAGGQTRRSDHVAVVDEALAAAHVDRPVDRFHVVQAVAVAGRRSITQEASRREHHGACADAGHQRNPVLLLS